MKTHITPYTLALISALSLSGCTADFSGALPGNTEEAAQYSDTAAADAQTVDAAAADTSEPLPTQTEEPTEDSAFPESPAPEARTISTDNFTFVDYDYISGIRGITAEECPWAAEPATALMKESGKTVIGCTVYADDYDGDERPEAFTIVNCGDETDSESYVVFVNADGQAELANELPYYAVTSVDLLDYGTERHIVVNAYGRVGADTHSTLFGARDEKSVIFVDERVSFSKNDFIITAWGWQAAGGMLAYDIEAHKYLSVVGEPIDALSFYALDTNGVIDKEIGVNNSEEVRVLGNKYYLYGKYDYFGVQKFTYENGALVPYESDNIRNSMFADSFEEVFLDDYDAAVSAMLSPDEMRLENGRGIRTISPQNFSFVEPVWCVSWYQTNRVEPEIADFYDAAVKVILETEPVCGGKLVPPEDITDSYYLDENGNAAPQLLTAYHEDFDKNGTVECFMKLIYPMDISGEVIEVQTLVFIDSLNNAEILLQGKYFSADLIQYGTENQLLFYFTDITECHNPCYLYGVSENKAVLHESVEGRISQNGCFLSSFGKQGTGRFMVYDTLRRRYCVVYSEAVDYNEVKALDKDGVLPEPIDGYIAAARFDEKYYIFSYGAMDPGNDKVFAYENGRFTHVEDSKMRFCHDISPRNSYVKVESIDGALAETSAP